MKLPIPWLEKYIDVTMSAAKLAESLTLTGTKVEDVESKSQTEVIDIEITSNRPDCLSLLGLAQEVSAITGKKIRVPSVYDKPEKKAVGRKGDFDILIEDKKACSRYTARILTDVRVGSSPSEAQRFLAGMGCRSISNVVDVTNYVLFECGQPMHAFDLDKIEGGRVIVRQSRKGEKFLGLDGIEYTLDDKTLVIADSRGPIAMAGVLGGKTTEVGPSTKNVLLESAYFDPMIVRQASKKYKISTESSYRFERGVNPEMIHKASRRAAELMGEWAHAKDSSGLLDKNFIQKKPAKTMTLRAVRMQELLGMKVSTQRAASILKSLGFVVSSLTKDKLTVKTNPARRDAEKEIDLIEEVLRIEGFDKVPVAIPSTRHPVDTVRDLKAAGMMGLKKFLAASGFDEIMTYSLLSAKKIEDLGLPLSKAHHVVNFVSAEQEYFRPGLLPGMLDAVLFNAHRKASSLKFFEIGNRLNAGREETVLALGLYGLMDENWVRKNDSSFYDLKGIVENVLDHLRVRTVEWLPSVSTHGLACGSDLLWEKKPLGAVGEVSDRILKRWDLSRPVFYAEILLEGVFEKQSGFFKVRPVAKFPVVHRDIAFIIDNRVSVNDLESAMRSAGSPFLTQVRLFDQFTGKNVASGKRSLAFALSYQKEDGTFTDAQIQELQDKVGQTLKRLYQVEFR